MESFHKWFRPPPVLSPTLAILTGLSNLHASSHSAIAAREPCVDNRLVSLACWMLLILNSSWNQSGRGGDPSYSSRAMRITRCAEEGMIGTTTCIGFRSDLQPLQWDNLSSKWSLLMKEQPYFDSILILITMAHYFLIATWPKLGSLLHDLFPSVAAP